MEDNTSSRRRTFENICTQRYAQEIHDSRADGRRTARHKLYSTTKRRCYLPDDAVSTDNPVYLQ